MVKLKKNQVAITVETVHVGKLRTMGEWSEGIKKICVNWRKNPFSSVPRAGGDTMTGMFQEGNSDSWGMCWLERAQSRSRSREKVLLPPPGRMSVLVFLSWKPTQFYWWASLNVIQELQSHFRNCCWANLSLLDSLHIPLNTVTPIWEFCLVSGFSRCQPFSQVIQVSSVWQIFSFNLIPTTFICWASL